MKKCCLLLLCILSLTVYAQRDSSSVYGRSVGIAAGQDSIFLDSLPVISQSIEFRDRAGQKRFPGYVFHQNPFAWVQLTESQNDSLSIRFETLSFPIERRYSHKDSSMILPESQNFNQPNYQVASPGKRFTPFKGLSSAGSISRGISVGNNQDAVLQSDLNLQLSGEIAPQTTLSASINDNNLPVQADGYTQQLREFDRVYLELENPDFGKLRAGDYSMQSDEHYFIRFNKRISGAGVFTQIPLNEGAVPLELQGGLARGRFARNRFMAQEGNQGPYKLEGARGEDFIIIISGSERVYVDGILQKRGEQYDYVIDYNAGEISFTALQPMTREKRIVVEFQYTEQNYLRSVFYTKGGFENEQGRTTVQYYSEQDNKNQPLLQDLSDEEERQLANAGNSPEGTRVSSITPAAFSDEQVLYELRDSLGFDSVLVYSTDSTSRLYRVNFLEVGSNKGNYVISRSNANGRVFEWVPPENGVPQGNYAPLKRLAAPTRLQVLSLSSQLKISSKHQLDVQLAASKDDQNLFAETPREERPAAAAKIRYGFADTLAGGAFRAGIKYEFNDKRFSTLERIRSIEFNRDWNLPQNSTPGLQLAGVELAYKKQNWSSRFDADLLESGSYRGLKNQLQLRLSTAKQLAALKVSHLQSSDSLFESRFTRGIGSYRYQLTSKWWAGIRGSGEWNRQQNNDSLIGSSYAFLDWTLFSGIGDTTGNFAELSYTQRFDDSARSDALQRLSRAEVFRLRSVFKSSFNSRLEAAINHRILKRLPAAKSDQQTTTLRVNYLQRFLKNAIQSSSFFEAGSGNEPRRNFSYIEVPAGQGQYTHTDYNNNGIKELSEFEIAPTPDLARYLRVFSITDEYIRTSIQKFGQTLNINAPQGWNNEGELLQFLQNFSILLNYQLNRKTILQGVSNTINPFSSIESDSLLVSLNENFRSSFFFRRGKNDYGGYYTYRQTGNRNLLSFGLEERLVNEHRLNGRYRLWEPLLARAEAAWILQENTSANLAQRSFELQELYNRYSLSYQTASSLQLSSYYSWSEQNGTGEAANAVLFSQDMGLQFQYNGRGKLSGTAEVSYIHNDFSGEQNSPLGFEMLQELKPGDNGRWSLILQRNIRENVLLSLNYSGRVSPGNKPVHTGNLEVRAFF